MSARREPFVFAERDGAALSGDLYRPEGPGPHPVLVAAPGGGWLRNQRQQLAAWGEWLAGQGFAVFAIEAGSRTASLAPRIVRFLKQHLG